MFIENVSDGAAHYSRQFWSTSASLPMSGTGYQISRSKTSISTSEANFTFKSLEKTRRWTVILLLCQIWPQFRWQIWNKIKFKITVKNFSTLFQGSWSDVPHRLESWPKKRLRDERTIQKRDRMSGALFGGCTTGLNQMTKKYFKMWSFSPVFLLQSGS